MPRGYPDYGIREIFGASIGAIDLTELAARLWSINTFDRRGEVVLMDDFESPVIGWAIAPLSSGTAIYDSTAFRSGSQSLLVTTAAVLDDYVELFKSIPVHNLGKIGIEWSFSPQDKDMKVVIRLDLYDGTTYYAALIEVYANTGLCRLFNENSAYVDIATVGRLVASTHAFHTIKMVIDTDSKVYYRFVINNIEVDISTYPLYNTVSTSDKRLVIDMRVYTEEAQANQCFLDDMILTKNEP